ncbi:MAG TPA: TetR/AcrR family transcriptional regulator C-terminal ligand-binding domain-containing protein [Devosiaceae bacterium]|jgi:AcrR family transcriptional regulator|nr:TetR/AcrR family transcriptional regulator C-terminal ligand-binding domain-containing protein [Devosiaceae bacterium]
MDRKPADGKRRASVGARRSADTEAAILEAAEALLREGGLASFSIEAVARRARAGKPTIYRWWPNKTRLLLDVYLRQKSSMEAIDTGSIEGDCLALLEGLFAYWKSGSGQVFRSVFAEAQSDDTAAEALRDYAADRRAVTGQLFERAKMRGELSDNVDPAIAAELIAAYAWSRLLTGRLDALRQELEATVRQMLRGVLKR